LVDETPLNVNGFIALQEVFNSCELDQCLVEFFCSSVHETQMEHGCNKRIAEFERIFEEDNGVFNLLFF